MKTLSLPLRFRLPASPLARFFARHTPSTGPGASAHGLPRTQAAPAWQNRMRGGTLAAVLGVLALSAAAPAWALDLAGLAALLAQKRNAEARFVEERFVAGLDQPLRSSGTLSFSAPDRFSRTTLEPRPESMSVEGNTVTLKRGGRTRQMTLDAVPEATALLAALRGTLNGDLATLQTHYAARVDGNAARWKLTLQPLAQRLGTQVRQLDIEGQGPDLKTVEVLLAGGDRSVMNIEALPAGSRPAAAPAAPPSPGAARATSSARPAPP